MKIVPKSSFAAFVYDCDLKSRTEDLFKNIQAQWTEYPVLIFKNQKLDFRDLESIVPYLGDYLEDPYIDPIDSSKYVAEVLREANETTEIFAEGWHSDWFHLKTPPKGTILYAREIPPVGGDTFFADQYKAYENLPEDLKQIIDNHIGLNSARRGYAPLAKYGIKDIGRSMKLKYSRSALEIIEHPLYSIHPESNKPVINCNHGYTISIKDFEEELSKNILKKIFNHQTKEEFVYRHTWEKDDLVLWDNRCTLHRASGGYNGYRRSLYRITIQ